MKELHTWKPIVGYEGHYEVSNSGEIKSLQREFIRNGYPVTVNERILKQTIGSNGYYETKLCINGAAKTRPVHRLIAKAFILNSNQYRDINHLDGNKLNNSLDNLEWCTHLMNMQHAYRTGLIKRPKGKYHWATKKIIDKITGQDYESTQQAAAVLNINPATLRCMLSGHRTNKTNLAYA